MKYYPIYLNLRDVPCLVIGGGEVAERKALSLLEAGADVTLVSPETTPKLRELSFHGKIKHVAGDFEDKHIAGMFLVIAATDSPEVNVHAAGLCRKKHTLVNVAAPPEESTFIVPSVVERGDLVMAISTSGASPAMSRKLRLELEERYGPEYEVFLKKLAAVRKRLKDEAQDGALRREALQKIINSDALELFRQGKAHEAEHLINELAGLKHR